MLTSECKATLPTKIRRSVPRSIFPTTNETLLGASKECSVNASITNYPTQLLTSSGRIRN